jgi:hypothetical protein
MPWTDPALRMISKAAVATAGHPPLSWPGHPGKSNEFSIAMDGRNLPPGKVPRVKSGHGSKEHRPQIHSSGKGLPAGREFSQRPCRDGDC